MYNAKEVGLVDGFVAGRDCVFVSHLQFVDDSIFLSFGMESKMANLFSLLKLAFS